MNKFYVTVAAFAAVLAIPAASTSALAGSDATISAIDTPSTANTVRQVDLLAEPIQQPADAAQPENQTQDQPAAPSETAEPTADTPVESSGAASETIAEPITASRICRKFSAAIAMVIEVPCDRHDF